MFDKIVTDPGSPVVELDVEGEEEEGECKINPTPNLFAEPSNPIANNGLIGDFNGLGCLIGFAIFIINCRCWS